MKILLADVKRITEKATGWKWPDDLKRFGGRKPRTYGSRMTGLFPIIPNGRSLSTRAQSVCRKLSTSPRVSRTCFESEGWGNSWRDGIYDYVHYHSGASMKCSASARGTGRVQFWAGPKGARSSSSG